MNSNQNSAAPIEVGAADFETEVLKSSTPVLVLFWAPWSRPCHIFDAALEEVASTCAGRVKVVKVNADDHPDLSLWYEIQSIPTLLCFVNGIPHAKVVGTASKEAILSKLETVFRGGQLWLAPFITGNWLKDGQTLTVSNAPTRFGPVSYQVQSHLADGCIRATIRPPVRESPTRIVLRLRHPNGEAIRSVRLNGKRHPDLDKAGSLVRLKPSAQTLNLEVFFR